MGSEDLKALKTMGDHLRKRRLDLNLLQREVGERLGVCGLTVTNWELEHTEPGFRDLPAIIAFLGYDPRPEPVGIGDMIVWFREGRG